jgi:uncharacterized protein YaaQ
MKLIIAIVQERDKHKLSDRLLQNGLTFTKLGSTGGFLRQGNATLLIGVDDDQVLGVLETLRDVCGVSEEYVNLGAESCGALALAALAPRPVKSETGGAVAFVLTVDQFQRF